MVFNINFEVGIWLNVWCFVSYLIYSLGLFIVNIIKFIYIWIINVWNIKSMLYYGSGYCIIYKSVVIDF